MAHPIVADSYGTLKSCAVCKEAILGGNVHKLEDKFIHSSCYKCSKCNASTTPELAQVRNSVITCTPCYGKSHWKRCCKCSEPMKPNEILTVVNSQMHPKCYCCSECKQSMLPGRQYMLESEVFCSMKCATNFQNAKFKKQQDARKAANQLQQKMKPAVAPSAPATNAPTQAQQGG